MAPGQAIIIERLLSKVPEYGASDVHLTVGMTPILRRDGKLSSLADEPVVTPDLMDAVLEQLFTPDQRAALGRDKSLMTTYDLAGKARYKVNAFYQKGYPSVSLHYILPAVQTIGDLGLPPMVERFAQFSNGLVLICGPFGSGRSSTLAALVDLINRERAAHILTIERPIEHLFVNAKSVIEQREVGTDVPSFEQGLADSLQEDVDVIMLSELESSQAIATAIKAAASGRLILSTLSTNSTVGAIEKILASFPPGEQEQVRTELSGTLQGVIAQVLLPRTGGGRIAVAEVLTVNAPIRSIIRDGDVIQIQTILQTSREEGMIPLDRALADQVRAGTVSMDDALQRASDATTLQAMLQSP